MAVLDRKELEQSPLSDLHAIASELGIEGFRLLRREKLIDAIVGGGDGGGDGDGDSSGEEQPPPKRRRSRGGRGRKPAEAEASKEAEAPKEPEAETPERDDEPDDDESAEVRGGVLDILPNGSGFMRPHPFQHSNEDVYVSPAQIRRCELRPGDEIEGPVRSPRRNERHPSLVRIDKVNGGDAEVGDGARRRFDDLTPVYASQKIQSPEGLDAVPFGRGSRIAVGGPAGSGITTVLRRIVGVLTGGDTEVVVVLAGARPEEVTEWRRDESGFGVAGGAFDRPVDEQAQAAEMAVERGKRAVEQGRHAAIVIDSLDALPPSVARRVFGAARATEEAGTLTVVASTGLAGEPMRLATTRIILEPADGDQPKLAPGSGTLRSDLLA